jgi:hypothetical protein
VFLSFVSTEQKLLEDRNDWRKVFHGDFCVFVTKLQGDFIKRLQVAENNLFAVGRLRNVIDESFQHFLQCGDGELINKFFDKKVQLWEVNLISLVFMIDIN